MNRHGFIHDKLDIKMLELYLLARAAGPVPPDLLADLVMRHEGAEYFDFAESTAELVESGHLQLGEKGYTITEKGRVNSQACESSLARSVRLRCEEHLAEINRILRRDAQIRGEKELREDGSVLARMRLGDGEDDLLTLELLCPSQEQADRLLLGFRARPEQVYHSVLEVLSSAGEPKEEV